jgi:two-component system, NarL family, response regulator LiaR
MSEPKRIKVMIVDDHGVVRSGLSAFLQVFDDLELCAQAESGEQALELCEKEHPDVVLMDLVLGEAAGQTQLDGAGATRLIRKRFPDIQVIALTSFKEPELVQAALQAGAIGYLLKNVSTDDLANAIRAAYAGKPTLAAEATRALIHSAVHPEPDYEPLTQREQEVLTLMVQGLNNTEIAGELFISRSTAKFHVSSILAKLGATSRTEAVALAVQHRLVRR